MMPISSWPRPVRRRARTIGGLAALLVAGVGVLTGLTAQPVAASDDPDGLLAGLGRADWSNHSKDAFGARGRRAALAPDVPDDDDEDAKPRRKGKRVASLGPASYSNEAAKPTRPKRSVAAGAGGGITWSASAGCLNGSLRSVIADIAANYGSVRVNSTCRSSGHNRRVGGARKSHHLAGNAVDFRVFGNVGAVYAYLKSSGAVGGLKHYGGGLFHIDTGSRRSW